MKYSIVILILIIGVSGYGQDTIKPEFKGGRNALYVFIAQNIKYPRQAEQQGIQGTVFVDFLVEPDGSISNIEALTEVGGGCEEEAIRLISLTNGHWSPGSIEGKAVQSNLSIPIKFTLGKDGKPSITGDSFNKGMKFIKDGNYKQAIDCFSIYQPGDEYFLDAIYARGMCKFMLNDFNAAISDLEEAKSRGHQGCQQKLAEAYNQLGNKYLDEKKYQLAASQYSKALENTPDDVKALNNRGLAFLGNGENGKACEDWQKVLELGSMNSKSYLDEYCK